MNQLTSTKNIEDLFRSINTVYRIDKLQNALYPTKEFLIQSLKNIWIDVIDKRTSAEQAQERLHYLPKNVTSLYSDIQNNTSTSRALDDYTRKKFNTIEKDLESVHFFETKEQLIARLRGTIKQTLQAIQETPPRSIEDAKESFRTKFELSDLERLIPTSYIHSYQNLHSLDELNPWIQDTLLHLENDSLSYVTSESEKALTHLQKIWAEYLTQSPSSLEESKQFLIDQLKKAHKIPEEVKLVYIKLLETSTDLENLKRSIESFLNHSPETIDHIISEQPKNILHSLRVLWRQTSELASTTSIDEAREFIDKELQKFPIAIRQIYQEDLKYATTLDKVQAYAQRYFKDTASTQFNPLSSTNAGKTGNPKIIHCPVKKSDGSFTEISGFLKHFTSPIEFQHHLLYKALFTSGLNASITPPEGLMLDLKEHLYADPSGAPHPINAEMTERFQTIFNYFSTTHTKRNLGRQQESDFQTFVRNNPIGIFEKLLSPNLFNFLRSKYGSLSNSQKEQLLEQIGMITYLDFMIGDRDRFANTDVQYTDDSEEYQLFDLECDLEETLPEESSLIGSNLENLMVSLKEDGSILSHPIDNNLGDGTRSGAWISDNFDRDLYVSFLEKVLSKENPEKSLFIHLQKSLYKTIKGAGDSDENTSTSQSQSFLEDFTPFLEDLKLMSKEDNSMIQGMRKMRSHLETEILGSWESEAFSDLKSKIHPELTATISERLKVLKDKIQTTSTPGTL